MKRKRLLVEFLIVAAVIALGWNKPLKDWVDQTYSNITHFFDSLGK